jgi:hypothetical protein
MYVKSVKRLAEVMRRLEVKETEMDSVGLVGLMAWMTLRLKTCGGAVNKGLISGLAAIPATNIRRVSVAKVETAVALLIKTFALPAGEGLNVIVPFNHARCTTAWQLAGPARRRRREINEGKILRDMIKLLVDR